MNSGHNPSISLAHEQALFLNEQLAQILLNNVTTSLQWLELSYFEAIRLNDTFAKTTANSFTRGLLLFDPIWSPWNFKHSDRPKCANYHYHNSISSTISLPHLP